MEGSVHIRREIVFLQVPKHDLKLQEVDAPEL